MEEEVEEALASIMPDTDPELPVVVIRVARGDGAPVLCYQELWVSEIFTAIVCKDLATAKRRVHSVAVEATTVRMARST